MSGAPGWLGAGLRGIGALLARSTVMPALGVVLSIAVIGLLGQSYRSVREWQRMSELLADQRAETMLTLGSAALSLDMKGAQASVLLPIELEDIQDSRLFDLRETFARGFARFRYVDSFFMWRDIGRGSASLIVFNRTDRPPAWDPSSLQRQAYPAVLSEHPERLEAVATGLLRRGSPDRRFVIVETQVDNVPYQVVAKLLPASRRGAATAAIGFIVNLRWVREHYFGELAMEVASIGDSSGSVALVITDSDGGAVTATRPVSADVPTRARPFLPIFFDASMLSTLAPGTPPMRPWTVMVGAVDDAMLAAARRGSRATYAVWATASIAGVIGMLVTARAVRARAKFAEMQSDFVCAVTHELKTPLAFIRLLGETLHKRRYDSTETLQEYANLLSQESWRLTRLIDNLLTVGRVASTSGRHHFEDIEIAELVEETLNRFRLQLADRGFDVKVDVPHDLPRVKADRAMLLQAMDNLVDNAIRYSNRRRELSIRSWADDQRVSIDVADKGEGILPEDLSKVFEKFYRGRSATAGGSGLGLAIVKRVIEDHRGSIVVNSVPDAGTSVRLILPLDLLHAEAVADH